MLEGEVDEATRNEAAYRLARIHFQKDQPEDALRALEGFRRIMDSYGVGRYRAVATSAVREAVNRDTFLDRVRMRAGIDVEVIDFGQRADVDLARKSGLGGAGRRDAVLFLRQCDAHDPRAVIARERQRHAAPAAADIENAHPRFDQEFLGDMRLLGGLRLVERHVG